MNKNVMEDIRKTAKDGAKQKAGCGYTTVVACCLTIAGSL